MNLEHITGGGLEAEIPATEHLGGLDRSSQPRQNLSTSRCRYALFRALYKCQNKLCSNVAFSTVKKAIF